VSPETKRRWRDHRTAAGRRTIKEFIDGLSDVDAAERASQSLEPGASPLTNQE
jgi:hypothetical protein